MFALIPVISNYILMEVNIHAMFCVYFPVNTSAVWNQNEMKSSFLE